MFNIQRDTKIFYISIIAVFFASVLGRLSLAYYTFGLDDYMLGHKYIPILTPDAGLYGYYASLLLDGKPHDTDVSLIEYLIYFFVKYLSFDLDSVMYFAPAFLASLIIIPIMLILKEYTKNTLISSLSGLVAMAGYGYYSRSYLGYFDTDVLNLFFPLMIVYGMMMFYRKDNLFYIVISVVSNMLYYGWYHSSEPLLYGLNGFFILFGLVFYFKNPKTYKASILLAISVIKISILYKVSLLVGLFGLFYRFDVDYRYFVGLFLLAFCVIAYKANIDYTVFEFHLNRYFYKTELIKHFDFNFVEPMQYVAEASGISFMSMVVHMCGNIAIFTISMLGYLLFVKKHKEFVLSLPLLILGFMSMSAGIRFYIYGVFVLITTYGFFAYVMYDWLYSKLKHKLIIKVFVFALFVSPLYETYYSIKFWNTNTARPVFTTEQVEALKYLTTKTQDNDYIVTWWDYGWPIWYYTKLNTMIDNGRHHEDNYTVAKIFMMNSQKEVNKAIHYFYNLFQSHKDTAILQALQENDNDINKVFEKFKDDKFNPPNNNDKYIVIPMQMKELLFTMHVFENVDLKTGQAKESKIFMELAQLAEDDKYIFLEKGIGIDKKNALIMQNNDKIPIKEYDHIIYKDNQKLLKEIPAYKDGLYVVKFLDKFYIMDEYFHKSLFVQLLFYNNYDPKYFEDIYTGKTIAIYKVK